MIPITALAALAALGLVAAPPLLAVEGTAPAAPAPAAQALPSAAEPEPPPAAAAFAADPAKVFVEANAAYERGDYRQAIAGYRRLLDAGRASGDLYYNYGNALLRSGELGRAIAAYRQSLRLLPRDEDVRANLAFARRSAKDAIRPPEPSPWLATLFFWHYGLSPRELAAAAVGLNVLFWALVSARLFRRDSEALRWAVILVLVPLLALAGSWLVRTVLPARVAVVVPPEIGARTGPSADEVVRFRLHAGTEVAVEDRRDGWLRISLPDGQQGWIEGDHALEVEL